jgi:1-deoxy-D-xylulose-5-phosphate synthase
MEEIIIKLPLGKEVGQRFKRSFKGLLMPTLMWEELGFAYLGPLDGHDLVSLEKAFHKAQAYRKGPVLLHAITKKGKGYYPAENDAISFHGVAANGSKVDAPTYSEIFGQTILRIAKENPKVVAITAAMLEGTDLNAMAKGLPARVFDVGICEQHAVTFAAGLAAQGFIPIVAVYSTFLQRAFDQIVHDVCLQRLPVIFAIDRGGIVGEDGKSHQGTLDLSYLSCIPNLVLCAPKDGNELQHLLYTAVQANRPMAIRYPRGEDSGEPTDTQLKELPIGKGEILHTGDDIAILAVGATVSPSIEAANVLKEQGISCTVINARFIKPLDIELISNITKKVKILITVEENTISGGFGSAVLALVQNLGCSDIRIKCLGIPDVFVEHGSQQILRSNYQLDASGITEQILFSFPELLDIPARGGRSGMKTSTS